MMKFVTWACLLCFAFFGFFKVKGGVIDNNILAILLMMLLITLFSDLKEFNFWGLWGKKSEKDFRDLESKDAIPRNSKPTEIDQEQVAQVSANTPLQLMDNLQGNFLAFAFEIERLLRIYATVTLVKDIPQTMSPVKLVKELRDAELLTDNGVKQIEAIRWLRNILVHGRQSEINEATLQGGIQIASTLYQELNQQLNPQTNNQ